MEKSASYLCRSCFDDANTRWKIAFVDIQEVFKVYKLCDCCEASASVVLLDLQKFKNSYRKSRQSFKNFCKYYVKKLSYFTDKNLL